MSELSSRRIQGRVGGYLKRVLVGRAVASQKLEHTLLPKILALPVFSSDALSSVAYATEEILTVLLGIGVGAVAYPKVLPISVAIALLMAIVVTSYRQTVRAYPNGGGAYIVSKDNLGTVPGLVAAAALLVDYVLTVSVSIVAGVFALVSAAPALNQHKVILSLVFIAFITLANLRGVRESGTLFAVPTYAFILSILSMIVVGLIGCVGGCPAAQPVTPLPELAGATAASIPLFQILRAFASGSTALTGVEAISNGVPAFRRPQARNAGETLAIMATIAITMFLGISFLASHMHVTVSADRSVVAQIAHTAFGGGFAFYMVQTFTTAILVLAANTSFQDFPRLSAILARDRFMPRQFQNRGDRLVFSNGVIVLAGLAGLLVYAFDANLSRLIQLYVVGVFTSFTLSQTGMVRHWLKERHRGPEAQRGWQRAIVINAIGAVATFIVLIVVLMTKFEHGAWIVVVAIPVLVVLFMTVHRHYVSVMTQLRRGTVRAGEIGVNHLVLLVRELDAATAEAVGVVRSIRPTELHVVHPTSNGIAPELQQRWREFSMGAPDLEVLPVSNGNLTQAVRAYIGRLDRASSDFVNVVIPEVIGEGLAGYLFRRWSLVRLKAGLLREPNVVVTDVPVHVDEGNLGRVDGRPLIPSRTVALAFVSAVNDASIRAVNYAQSLEAAETRAIYFDLDPDVAHRMQEEWGAAGLRIPLDIVEAPFRDLTGPMLDEVRRHTEREDTVVLVVVPEFVVRRWRQMVLHNQNALFVKRLFLFEPRVVLSSVPFPLETR
ncbi:MAG TPA: APC family permease [Actinomycetota bacterium]|jgi:amino acid transporter|nr:APC family permease [Actinomycetota bacterium]